MMQWRMGRPYGRGPMPAVSAVEQGFTLIELLVVLLIMGILLAIAVPTFLGAKSTAENRGAQANLSNAVTAARSVYSASQSYPAIDSLVPGLRSDEPSISFVAASTSIATVSPRFNTVGVTVGEPGTNNRSAGSDVILVAHSATGACWAAWDSAKATTGPMVGGVHKAGTYFLAWKQTPTQKCGGDQSFLKSATWNSSLPAAPPGT